MRNVSQRVASMRSSLSASRQEAASEWGMLKAVSEFKEWEQGHDEESFSSSVLPFRPKQLQLHNRS